MTRKQLFGLVNRSYEEDLELPEDSTVLAVIVESHPARQPASPQRPEDGIEGLTELTGSHRGFDEVLRRIEKRCLHRLGKAPA